MSAIRVGLIGHGPAGAIIHAPLIEAAGEYHISVVATSRADSLNKRRDKPRADADPFAVVRANDVDLVVVASPNSTHFPIAKAALEAGKAVVIDKPFAISSRDAEELITLAAKQNCVLAAFHNRRWDGDFIAVHDMLRSNQLGELLRFEARWDRFRPQAPDTWRNSTEPGAGLLWDLGPHLIDQALLLFGQPDRITSDVAAQRANARADDYFELTFHYGRMRCILSASSVAAALRPRFALHGDKGSFLTFGVDSIEDALRAGRHPAEPGFASALAPISAEHWTPEGRTAVELRSGRWVSFYTELARAIRGEASTPVDPRDALAGIRIIERALGAS